MSPLDAVKTCLQKYATFEGRATRAEFWWFVLFYAIAISVGVAVDLYVMGAATLLLLLPLTAVTTRRLHDTNRSGWMQLLNLVPLGNLYVLYLLVQRSQQTGNRF
jgi:uncharacterized membrane protein YhaH (DUF805 family)